MERERGDAIVGDEEEVRQARFERVMAAHKAGLSALTILRARRYLDECPGEGPLDYFVWFWLGETLAELGRYGEAEEALTNALRLCPEGRERVPLCEMGHLNGRRGEYQRAADWFRKAIEAAPRHAGGYIHLGSVLSLQGRLREAEEVHRTAIETCYEGCLDEAFLNLGLVLRAQERFDEAAECFREAIRIDPGYRDARRALRDVERCLRMTKRR
jgi:tetratricopeptide (TPR) repeat protein